MNFFINSLGGSVLFSVFIHGIFYAFLKLMYELGGFKKIFNEIFGVSSYTGVFNYSSLIGNLFKYNDFTIKIWLEYFVYRFSIIVLIFSFVFSTIFLFTYKSRKSGDDLTSTWNVYAVILLFLCLIGGITYTPIVKFSLLSFSYFVYLFVGFLPFYITTLVLCGTTAFKSYSLKKRFS